jgi:hypothetical protein
MAHLQPEAYLHPEAGPSPQPWVCANAPTHGMFHRALVHLHPEAGAFTVAMGWRECAHPWSDPSIMTQSEGLPHPSRAPGIGEAVFQTAPGVRNTPGVRSRWRGCEPRATVMAPASGCTGGTEYTRGVARWRGCEPWATVMAPASGCAGVTEYTRGALSLARVRTPGYGDGTRFGLRPSDYVLTCRGAPCQNFKHLY